MAKNQHGSELTGPEMAEMLDEFINANAPNGKEALAFAAHVTERTHRTLQQRIMGLFLRTIHTWAQLPDGRYDPRNEATVKVARKVFTVLDKYDIDLPRI